MKQNLIGCIVIFVAGTVVGQQRPQQTLSTLRATRFELVDSNGQVVGLWQSTPSGDVELSLGTRPSRDAAILLSAGSAPPSLMMRGTDGKERVRLTLNRRQRPYLGMSDEMWEGRAILGSWSSSDVEPQASGDDEWALIFTKRFSQSPVVRLGARTNGQGVLNLKR